MDEILVYDVDWQFTLSGGHYTKEEVQEAYPLENVIDVEHVWLQWHKLSYDDCDDFDLESGSMGFHIFDKDKRPKGVVSKATGVYLD